jgi:cytochrome c-type biogenesis protein CcmF
LISGNRHRYGGYTAHIGVLLACVGITASSAFKTEREITLAPGESVRVADHEVRLDKLGGREEPGRTAIGADVTVLRGGSAIAHLEPRQHFYGSSEQPIPTPAVRSTLTRDVYVNLMAFKEDGSSATIRVLVEPLVVWIWIGGGIVCLGALVSLWPRARTAGQTAEAAVVARTNADVRPAKPRKRRRRRTPAEVAT